MAIQSIDSLQTKFHQFVFGGLLVALALYCVRGVSSGATGTFRMVVGLIVFVGIVLALDRRYWILFFVFSNFNIKLPGLPFNGTELAWVSIVPIHWMRIAFHREASAKLNREFFAALPFILWVLFTFCLNPVGMNILGSNSMGGRFYFQIFFSFLAFVAVSSLEFNEKDAKLVFWTLVICSALSAFRAVFRHEIATASNGYVESSSAYFLIPFTQLYVLCCSRWSLSSVFKKPHRLLVVFCTAMLSLVSGKRQMLGRVFLCPVFRCFVTKKDFLFVTFLGVLGALFVFAAVAGDGAFYTMPPGLRRSLAVLVPSYRRRSDDGGVADLFRREIRREAYALIRDKPWMGRKGFAMDREETVWQNFGGTQSSHVYEGHASAGNWHNLYLAYACDFGIPGFVFAMILLLCSVRYALAACRIVNTGGYCQVCCLFFAFEIIDIAVFGWVNGHSAISTYSIFGNFGPLIALVNGFKSMKLGGKYGQAEYQNHIPNSKMWTE